MQIGQFAEQAGVSPDTVRFYERRGVLPRPERRPSGYRVYTVEALERIRLAKVLKRNGFTLDEVVAALHALDEGTTCADERWRVEHVLARIERQLEELQAVRRTVLATLDDCDSGLCRINPEQGPPTPV